MKFMTALATLALLTTSALAQDSAQSNKKGEPAPTQQKVVPQEAPKEKTPLDNFEMKSTDTGDKVQQRLKVDLSKDKNLFLYGNKTTTYPTGRDPGQDFQPAIPQASPKDSYSIGIGIGRRF